MATSGWSFACRAQRELWLVLSGALILLLRVRQQPEFTAMGREISALVCIVLLVCCVVPFSLLLIQATSLLVAKTKFYIAKILALLCDFCSGSCLLVFF